MASYGYQGDGVISAVIHQLAQVGLMYLGAGLLLWVVVVIIAMAMR